jgi:hypothetical protein
MTRYLSISAPIGQKIKWSQTIYQDMKHRLLRDTHLSILLNELRGAINQSRHYLMRSGISKICAICDKEEGGSCCGKGIEDKYTSTVLLINLLLGVKLPEKSVNKKDCIFLSSSGCILFARDTICINYLCSRIQKSISPATINMLREKEGVELEKLFLLNEYLMHILGISTNPPWNKNTD